MSSMVQTQPVQSIRNAVARVKRTLGFNVGLAVSAEAKAIAENISDCVGDELALIEEALAAIPSGT